MNMEIELDNRATVIGKCVKPDRPVSLAKSGSRSRFSYIE